MAIRNDDHGAGAAAEGRGMAILLAILTAALLVIVMPFLSPLFWAILAAIVFQPLYRRILGWMPGAESRAAGLSLLVILIAVILPALFIASLVVEEALGVLDAFRSGEIDLTRLPADILSALPEAARDSLTDAGWGDFTTVQLRAREFLEQSLGFLARQAVAIGGSVVGFVLALGVGLYVTFFLLRDGATMVPRILEALPLRRDTATRLAERFQAIVRATVKGSIVVGLVQGALGTITFLIVGIPSAILFGVLMAFFSLLPALGPAIVWGPVAVYLLATGSVWEGVVVIASGVAVIGMADNVLRPILVGRDTGIPDWIILVTTLGGIAATGLSGIVIGPLVAGLFLAAWATYREERIGAAARPAAE